jgi:hypothetical protein
MTTSNLPAAITAPNKMCDSACFNFSCQELAGHPDSHRNGNLKWDNIAGQPVNTGQPQPAQLPREQLNEFWYEVEISLTVKSELCHYYALCDSFCDVLDFVSSISANLPDAPIVFLRATMQPVTKPSS